MVRVINDQTGVMYDVPERWQALSIIMENNEGLLDAYKAGEVRMSYNGEEPVCVDEYALYHDAFSLRAVVNSTFSALIVDACNEIADAIEKRGIDAWTAEGFFEQDVLLLMVKQGSYAYFPRGYETLAEGEDWQLFIEEN